MRRNTFNHLMEYGLLLLLSVFILSSCSQDEPEVVPGTKAEILIAKAKEFAQKYGVEVNLNTENIDSIAKVLTVEQMEEDFCMIAALQQEGSFIVNAPIKRTNGVRISRMTSLVEDDYQNERDYRYFGEHSKNFSGEYSYTSTAGYPRTGRYSGTALLGWQYALGQACWVRISVSGKIGSEDFNNSTTLESSFSTSNVFSFYAIGKISATTELYTISFDVEAYYQEGDSEPNMTLKIACKTH